MTCRIDTAKATRGRPYVYVPNGGQPEFLTVVQAAKLSSGCFLDGKVVRVKDLLSPDLQLKLELQKPADTDDRINK